MSAIFQKLFGGVSKEPSRVGKPWTCDEEGQLLKEIADGHDLEAISQNHQRAIGGIKSRLNKIALRMHHEKVSNEEICRKLKFTPKQLARIIRYPVKVQWVPNYGFVKVRDNNKKCNVYVNICITNDKAYVAGIKVVFDFGLKCYNDFDMCQWIVPDIQSAIGKTTYMTESASHGEYMLDETEKYFMR